MKHVSFATDNAQTVTVTIIGEGEEIQVALQVYDGFDHCEITMSPDETEELSRHLCLFAADVRRLRADRKGARIS